MTATQKSGFVFIFFQLLVYILVSTGCAGPGKIMAPHGPAPFADVHLHFNWDQQELLSAKEAIERLKQNNVVLGVVSSVPSHYARKLAAAGNGRVISLFSPYITVEHRKTWFRDPAVIQQAREGLSKGWYQGIGELHLWDGMKPRQDNPVLQALLNMAVEFDVPFLIHTESSSHLYFAKVCQQHPKVRFLWAHAGGTLKAKSVSKLMSLCDNVSIDLSVRDPWRYDTLLTKEGKLPDAWHALINRYPDRVMAGTDPVWNVTRTQRWDEADAGWDHIHKLISFHRNWMKQLPAELEEKVRLKNAYRFFQIKK